MPDIPVLVSGIVAAGDPRTAHHRKAILAAGLRRILRAYRADHWTVVPIAHIEEIVALLNQSAHEHDQTGRGAA